MTVGRDPGSDWVIDDPDRTLSRRHCEFVARSDGLAVCISGVNGVFTDNEKLPFATETILALPCMLMIGDFRLAVSSTEVVPKPENAGITPFDPRPSSRRQTTDLGVPAYETAATNRSLLEAFCEGAGLDSSLLAGEEPDEIMRRAGAIYRHTVLGVRDLMADRDRARAQYDLQRTKIGGTGNNLFKWASTQRLAADLLLTGPAGFLSGPDAVRSSLRAIKRHFAASQAGMQGCIRAVVDMFSPSEIDRVTPDSGSSAQSRAAAQMNEVGRRYTELVRQHSDAELASLEVAYILAYEAADISLRTQDRDSLADNAVP